MNLFFSEILSQMYYPLQKFFNKLDRQFSFLNLAKFFSLQTQNPVTKFFPKKKNIKTHLK